MDAAPDSPRHDRRGGSIVAGAATDVSRPDNFSGRRITEAKSRSRATSQFGAQKGDRASKRLTRRPATHHHAPDSRARSQATADWLRTFGRIITGNCKTHFLLCLASGSNR
jgi:hypothetical protein